MDKVPLVVPNFLFDILKLAVAPFLLPTMAAVLSNTLRAFVAVCALHTIAMHSKRAVIKKIFFIIVIVSYAFI